MKLIKKPKLSPICYSDDFRPEMAHVLITKDEIVATNGHVLVVHRTLDWFDLDVIEAMPDRFMVHKNVWKLLEKPHYFVKHENGSLIVEYGTYNLTLSIRKESDFEKAYPKYNDIWPKEKESIDKIGVNPKLLKLMYDAMGLSQMSMGVLLKFYGERKSIIATNLENDCKGLIMPIMISE